MGWYILRYKTGLRAAAIDQIARHPYSDVFSPYELISTRHHRTKAWITKQIELFPGYLFINVDPGSLGPIIRGSPAVLGVVSVARVPYELDSKIIVELRSRKFDNTSQQDHSLKLGDKVKLEVAGVLLEAEVTGLSGESVVFVSGETALGPVSAERRGAELRKVA